MAADLNASERVSRVMPVVSRRVKPVNTASAGAGSRPRLRVLVGAPFFDRCSQVEEGVWVQREAGGVAFAALVVLGAWHVNFEPFGDHLDVAPLKLGDLGTSKRSPVREQDHRPVPDIRRRRGVDSFGE